MFPHDSIKPYFFSPEVRPFRLSEKDLAKQTADGVAVVSRPQVDGRYLVCAVNTCGELAGLPIGTGLLCAKAHVTRACQDIGRCLNKFYGRGGDMADAARDRPARKPQRQ